MARKKKKRPFVVSVRDFGAQGDGISDDSEAFEAARRCRARRIDVPPGCYEIKASVQIDHRFVSTVRDRWY